MWGRLRYSIKVEKGSERKGRTDDQIIGICLQTGGPQPRNARSGYNGINERLESRPKDLQTETGFPTVWVLSLGENWASGYSRHH